MNVKLQGSKMCLIKAKGIIMAFISKLDFYKNSLLRLDLNQFLSLQELREKQTDNSPLSDTDLDCYCSHLETLKKDLVSRFKDLKKLKIPEWVVNPFLADANNADPILVEELIDWQNDFEGKVLQQTGYETFWPKQQDRYPHLWKKNQTITVGISFIIPGREGIQFCLATLN